jgi:anti-sigma factor RsiW
MSDRVVRLDPAAHRVADALLPWFANGTLDPEERAFVERHLAECPRCRQEEEWLRKLYAACVAGEASPDAARVLHKLRKRLQQAPGRPRARSRFALRRPWTRWVMGVQLALILGLGGLWLQEADRVPAYRTLGAPSIVAPAAALVVVFDSSTPEAELRRVLRAAGARVVDGPTRSNAYVLAVPAERRARALETLRSERSVALAEVLDPERTR